VEPKHYRDMRTNLDSALMTTADETSEHRWKNGATMGRRLPKAIYAALVLAIGVSTLGASELPDSTARSPWSFRVTTSALRSAQHPQSIARQRVYGGTGRDDAYDIWPFAGGYVITGSSENPVTHDLDLVVLRVDAAGDVAWANTYGGAKRDIGFAVRTAGDDLIVVAGWTHSFGVGAGDFYLLGLDAEGDLRFARTFGGPGEERATALTLGLNRSILVLGESYSHGPGDARFYAVKTDSSGNLEWERTYDGGANNERGLAIVEVDNGWILVGNTMDTTSGSTATVSDGYVVRIDASGDESWNRRVGGDAHDILHHGVRLRNGETLLTGYTRGHGARGLNDVWLVRLDAEGRTVGMQVTGGSAEDHNIIARLASDGRVWLGGYCRAEKTGDWDVHVLELDARGKPAGSFVYGGGGEDGAVSLCPLERGGLLVAGYTTSAGAGDRDILLLELRPESP